MTYWMIYVTKFIKNNWAWILCAFYWAMFINSFIFPSLKKNTAYELGMSSIIIGELVYLGVLVSKSTIDRWKKRHPSKKTITLNLLSDKPKADAFWQSFDGKITKTYDSLGRIGTVFIRLDKKRNKIYVYLSGSLILIKTEHKGFDELIYWENGVKIHSFEKHNQKCGQWKSWFADGQLQQSGWMDKKGEVLLNPDETLDKLAFKDGYALGPDFKYYPDEDKGYDAI